MWNNEIPETEKLITGSPTEKTNKQTNKKPPKRRLKSSWNMKGN